MELSNEQKELMQFALDFEQNRRKRMFSIIQSDMNIEQEIIAVRTRLEMLFASEKKAAFYPHKMQIQRRIEEDNIYLEDLQSAMRYIEDLAHLDHVEYLSYESHQDCMNHLTDDLSNFSM